jgi:hypothetical protein
MSIWDKYLEVQEKTPTKGFVDKGYTDKSNYSQELEAQHVFANPEYNVISITEETVFVTDETGALHVFTRDEWYSMNGGMIGGGALVVALTLGGLAWLVL